jgi:hypothetical protein
MDSFLYGEICFKSVLSPWYNASFTAGPLCFWESNKMPFGLTNSPATYHRLVKDCLGDLNIRICAIYLGNLIIFSKTLEKHLE